MASEYEHFKGGKRVDKPEPTLKETIKERIDREVKEEQAAARQAQTPKDVVDRAVQVANDRRFEGMDSEQAHWRRHFEDTVFPKVGADDLIDFLELCAHHGRTVPDLHRNDYVWLHHQRQEWMLQFNGAENRAWLESIEQEHSPDPEYLRGFNEAMALRDAQVRTEVVPGPWTQQAIEDITKILGARGHSYTPGEDEFQNFTEQAQLGDQTMRQVFRGALGQKLAREKSTHQRLEELYAKEHESMEPSPEMEAMMAQWLDSIRDICGYALLFFGWAKRVEGEGQ